MVEEDEDDSDEDVSSSAKQRISRMPRERGRSACVRVCGVARCGGTGQGKGDEDKMSQRGSVKQEARVRKEMVHQFRV